MYSKVRFTSKYNGHTASIILSEKQQTNMTIRQIKRLFPESETLKMERLERGDYYDTFEEAYAHDIHGDLLPVGERILQNIP